MKAGPTKLEEDVAQAMTHYAEAFGAADVRSLEKILSDGFQFTSSNGTVFSKDQVLNDIRSESLKPESAEIANIIVRTKDAGAVVTCDASLKGTWHDHDFSGSYLISAIWIMEGGRWHLLSEQAFCTA